MAARRSARASSLFRNWFRCERRIDDGENCEMTAKFKMVDFPSEQSDQAASGEIEPFPYVLPRDITLVPKPFLIDGFGGAAEISACYGPPDGCKSAVSLYAGCHVAARLEYYGPPS